MTFVELVEVIAKAARVKKSTVAKILKASNEEILKALRTGETVMLLGFGVFYSSKRKGRSLFGGTRKSKDSYTVKFRLSRRRKNWKNLGL